MRSSLPTLVAKTLAQALPSEANLSVDEIAALLAPPPRADMGDLAFPCFRLAKVLKKAPPAIAADVVAAIEALEDRGVIARVGTSGPYVNVTLETGTTAAKLLVPWASNIPPTATPREQKVMVEYSQPNTHKAFHVGHMRNVCLGDSLVRLLRVVGYEVVAANYLGDVGSHIAKCLWYFLDELDDAGRTPPDAGRGEWLGKIYAKATLKLEDLDTAAKGGDAAAQATHEAVRARMTEILHAVDSGDEGLKETWMRTRQWSLEEFEEIYRWCGVHFDRLFYESEVDAPSLALVDEYMAEGVFVESDGAVGIFNEEIPYMPFFMLRKRDGTGLYATKDLALARLKFQEYAIDRSIYVVDVRQSDHFKHVFLTLKKMGFEQAERCHHVPYEMVELPEGAMSTRKGTVVLFGDLRATMTARLRDGYFSKYSDTWTDDEVDNATHEVALGAIKYGMLARDVNQKIVFDMEAWMEFEGNTGPYLQYVGARTASILRKGEERGLRLDEALLTSDDSASRVCAALEHPAERALLMKLDELPSIVAYAADKLRPSFLCTYLFELSKIYNHFQALCPVLTSQGDLLQARLLLVTAVRHALAWALSLLGVPSPARM
jgi:arginyl-tRNA synthetase